LGVIGVATWILPPATQSRHSEMPFKHIGKGGAVCTEADLKLENEINGKLKHCRVSAYSIPHDDGPVTYGMVSIFYGRSNTIEQDRPFIADQVIVEAVRSAGNGTAL
jgi:hypothetical protein